MRLSILFLVCSLLIVSCGGGGGSGTTDYIPPAPPPPPTYSWFIATNGTLYDQEENTTFRGSHSSVVFDAGDGEKMWVIGGLGYETENDGNSSVIPKNTVYSSVDGINWKPIEQNTPFTARYDHTSVVFKNKIWIIGGNDGNGALNSVYSSSDGRNWNLITQNTSQFLSARFRHTSVVFDANDGNGKKMWVIGGRTTTNFRNNVYSSVDGISWVEETSGLVAISRYDHTSIVFDGKIWLIGGYGFLDANNQGFLNTIYSSSDGKTWNLMNETGKQYFTPRRYHTSVVFDANDGDGEKMWVIGGVDAINTSDDVWSSSNGIDWNLVTNNAEFSIRLRHSSVVFNNGDGEKMWVIKGLTPQPFSAIPTKEVYSSFDGASWDDVEVANNESIFSARYYHTSLAFDANDGEGEKMWVIGGVNKNDNPSNEVWFSLDGVNWEKVIQNDSSKIFPARYGHSSVIFDAGIDIDGDGDTNDGETIWVIGGEDGNNTLSDVWSSKDGKNWYKITENFPSRYGHNSIVFDANDGNGKRIWVIGSESYDDSVYSSSNGKEWSLVTDNPGFEGRSNHTSIVFNDKMWLIGGRINGADIADVWSSSNGIDWTEEKENIFNDDTKAMVGATGAVFDADLDFDGTKDGERIWLIGGRHTSSNYSSYIYYSYDGINWDGHLANETAYQRRYHSSVIYKNALWIIGGHNPANFAYRNDVLYFPLENNFVLGALFDD